MKHKSFIGQTIHEIIAGIEETNKSLSGYQIDIPSVICFERNGVSFHVNLEKREHPLLDDTVPMLTVDPKFLLKTVDELELSVRANNCLVNANVKTIIDLVNLREDEIRNIKNLGRASYDEIVSTLHQFGLQLDMKISEASLRRLIRERQSEQE